MSGLIYFVPVVIVCAYVAYLLGRRSSDRDAEKKNVGLLRKDAVIDARPRPHNDNDIINML